METVEFGSKYHPIKDSIFHEDIGVSLREGASIVVVNYFLFFFFCFPHRGSLLWLDYFCHYFSMWIPLPLDLHFEPSGLKNFVIVSLHKTEAHTSQVISVYLVI